jgi:hypothetical protein
MIRESGPTGLWIDGEWRSWFLGCFVLGSKVVSVLRRGLSRGNAKRIRTILEQYKQELERKSDFWSAPTFWRRA